MDREASKVRKLALEQQERAERSAMQTHDKACYQSLPSAPVAGAGVGKSKKGRPSSGRLARGASDNESDWAVLPDTTAGPSDTAGVSVKASAFPASTKSVKLKPPVVIDQAAVDHEYYQSALPPKRPHVPRVNSENAVSMAKKKKEEVRCIQFMVP